MLGTRFKNSTERKKPKHRLEYSISSTQRQVKSNCLRRDCQENGSSLKHLRGGGKHLKATPHGVCEVSSHFLWLHFAFCWVGRGKKGLSPRPNWRSKFCRPAEFFFSVPTGNPQAPGKGLRLQKEPEERGPVGPARPEEGCKHPLESMTQKGACTNAL